MDAFELTRPILSSTRVLARRSAPSAHPTDDVERLLVEARRFTNQLPLGHAPGPGRRAEEPARRSAADRIELALWRTAAAFGVCVDVDEPAAVLAGRLVRARAIVAPAADAISALLPVLGAGVDHDSARLTARIVGYLDHRSEIGPRLQLRR